MTITLGSIAPDFTQDSTDGPISFHEGRGKVILFSHPKDYGLHDRTGLVARLKGEFRRNVKNSASSHRRSPRVGQGHRGDQGVASTSPTSSPTSTA